VPGSVIVPAMPGADPAALDLKALFRDASMFDSRSAWGAAGFLVIDRANNGKIMVARHPSVQGLLFKKYVSSFSQTGQLENYERRIEGAKRLRDFVDKSRFDRVVVPRKWLLELPRSFFRKESYVLAVEQLDLLGDEPTVAAYNRIDPIGLKELCTVLFHFRGMDSSAKNLPFVADGRIAFIDTEHWDRGNSKPYLHQVSEYLMADHRKLAKKIFDQLEDNEDSRVGTGAFYDEDTSDSSSSSS